MIDNKPSLSTQFVENVTDFTKKHGMKVCASIFLVANAALFINFLKHPEAVNPVRSVGAALLQEATNFYQLQGKKQKAYNFGTFGGACHTFACIQDGLVLNAITWAMYTEAAYRGSAWPQRLDSFSHSIGEKMPLLKDAGEAIKNIGKSDPIQKLTSAFSSNKSENGKNTISKMIENKVDLLKDPHARAGTVAFISTIVQWTEAALNHNADLLAVMPAWLLATGFYMAHGLLHARDKKNQAQDKPPQP